MSEAVQIAIITGVFALLGKLLDLYIQRSKGTQETGPKPALNALNPTTHGGILNPSTVGFLALGIVVSLLVVVVAPIIRGTAVATPTPIATQTQTGSAATEAATQVSTQPIVGTPPPSRIASYQIAFVSNRSGKNQIYGMDADGSNVERITNDDADDSRPSWSPDGQRMAFDSNRDGNREIYAMAWDGTGVQRLTQSSAQDSRPAWSPDGSQIAFDSNRGGSTQIYLMNADGSDVRQLTHDSANDYRPSWSPDGSQIAYYSDINGSTNLDIYIINVSGGSARRLTSNPTSDYSPAWSPGGKVIAYLSDRDGSTSIYVINTDGTNERRLTAIGEGAFSWSPDGAAILFPSKWKSSNFNIFKLDISSGTFVQITKDTADDLFPIWRPD